MSLLLLSEKELRQAVRLDRDLVDAIEHGIAIAEGAIIELGDVVIGKSLGRPKSGDVTVCDLTGTGAQDSVIAKIAVERAEALGFSQSFAG